MSSPPTQIGPYRILDKLGSGGMGTVYLGKHDGTGEMAAVKVLPGTLAMDAGFVARFEREIQAMENVKSPYIVKMYDSGVELDGTHWYAMEYVAGETLTAKLKRERKFPWEEACRIALQVCTALRAAHNLGIIHRDLKPSNLLIDTEGNVKLTDFGVAQIFDPDERLTVTGGIVGTAEFMSPEQAEGKKCRKQSDLYSLGAVLYCMLTGRPPFTGPTAMDVLQKHKFGRFDAAKLYVPDIPVWLDHLVNQLLEKKPEDRPPDALMLSRTLEQRLRQHEDAQESGTTTADVQITSGDDETIAEGAARGSASGAGGAGPATLMKHLLRAELEGPPRTVLESLFNNLWVLIGILVCLLGGTYAMYANRALTPEQKFARALQILAQEPSSDWSRARTEYLEPLVAADEERWGAEVQPLIDQIEMYEVERKMGRQGARRKSAPPIDEPHRFLKLAQAYRDIGDLARAERTLGALNVLLAREKSPERVKLYQFTTRLLESWREEEAERKRYEWIEDDVDEMQRLFPTAEYERADELHQALTELYGDDPGIGLRLERPVMDPPPAERAQ